MEYRKEGNKHFFLFDTEPVPASRPRVSRYGTYYGKTYNAYRKAFQEEVSEFRKEFRPLLSDRLKIEAFFLVKKPKTSKLNHPRGDIDNYLKALLDSCNELVWRDDVQITEVSATKEFDEVGSIELIVEDLDEYTP
tara:strand:+ start:1318 stop:1725 length:408 start_codon:yes stop_codon:yes gene_type:complete